MAAVIYRGSTPTIRMSPLNGMNVSELGTPTIAISQELVYLDPEVEVDTENNRVSVTLTEQESLQLVAGVETRVQMMWANNEDGTVIRFPVHEVVVMESVTEELLDENLPDGAIVDEDEEVETVETTAYEEEPEEESSFTPPEAVY